MNSFWQAGAALVAGLLLIWLALVVTLFVTARRGDLRFGAADALRLLPDVLRLVKRLATDTTLPRRVRWSLWGLLGYLLLPIDLVPDFLPVVGQADDAIVLALVLRAVVRTAGPEVVERHWPGTSDGLDVVQRLTGRAAPRRG